MAITFQKTGLSDLTLKRGALFPLSRPIEINQRRHETEGLQSKVVSFGSTSELFKLKFDGLPEENYDGTVNGLKTWFSSSTINWSENTFTLIDDDGISHTVRFWQDSFVMPQISAGRFSFSVTLKKES